MNEIEDATTVTKAIMLAAYIHDKQVDKAGKPYLFHALAVGIQGEAEDEQVLGFIHDCREDITEDKGTAEEFDEMVAELFGQRISDALIAISRREGETYEDFIKRCGENELARKVKIKDLHHNSDLTRITVLTQTDHRRQKKYQKALDYLNSL